MEHHKKHHDDKPIGAPHIAEETTESRPFELQDTKPENHEQKPRKTWATMPLWKKILVIWFSIVCAFGVYDTLFPSEKSLRFEDLLPIIATPTPTPTEIPVSPSGVVSPTLSPSPRK